VAEHDGYTRLLVPVTHRRTATFNKLQRWWLLADECFGEGEHDFAVRFHFDTGLEVDSSVEGLVRGYDKISGAKLIICPLDLRQKAEFDSAFTSRNYGLKEASSIATWSFKARAPCKFRWAILPVSPHEREADRLKIVIEFHSQNLDHL
jgi:Heparinase II/III-like protein